MFVSFSRNRSTRAAGLGVGGRDAFAAIAGLLVLIVAVFVSVVDVARGQTVDADCPTEAQALENCAARNAGADIQLLASCLSCVTDSLPDDADQLDCNAFGIHFCSNLDDECDPNCDEGPCGTQFRDFFHCIAGMLPSQL